MLGSLFLIVTVSAAALLGPAVVALLRVRPGRRAHVAEAVGSARRLHLVGAATLVGLGGLGVAALLGAGPFLALATAALHAGSVLAWARTYPSWGVRGVVVWTLQFTAAVGLLSWLVHRMATSEPTPVRLAVGAVAWLLLLVALVPAQRHLRGRIAARTDRDVAGDPAAAPAVGSSPLQAAVPVAALLVASGVVVAVSSGGPASPRDDPAQAGRSESPAEGSRGSPVGTPSGSASPAGSTQRDDGSASGSGDGSADGTAQAGTASTTGAPAPSGSDPAPPQAAQPQPTKTPGYEKEKPHRREDLPSHPGGPKAP